jgi:lipoate-protein ligase A
VTNKRCLFLATFERDARTNMEIDKRLLDCLELGRRDLFWRIYSWNPPALSIGKNQTVEHVLDLDHMAKDSIEFVKRPTGGRAIYHKNDICISSAGGLSENSMVTTAREIYLEISRILQLFLKNLGVETMLTKGPRLARTHRSGIGKLPCFLTATPYELMASGKKIAGIALFVGKDRYLAQSSLRVRGYEADDFRYFRGLKSSQAALRNVTSVEEETGCRLSNVECERALRKALSEYESLNVLSIEEEEIEG